MDLEPNTLATGEILQTIEVNLSETVGLLSGRAVNVVRTGRIRSTSPSAGEVLIPDSRADVSPAQSVERKLTNILRGGSIPVSHIRLSRRCGKS